MVCTAQPARGGQALSHHHLRRLIRRIRRMQAPQHRRPSLAAVIVANAAVLLINVATFRLKKLIVHKQENFLDSGGFSEQLYNNRIKKRKI